VIKHNFVSDYTIVSLLAVLAAEEYSIAEKSLTDSLTIYYLPDLVLRRDLH